MASVSLGPPVKLVTLPPPTRRPSPPPETTTTLSFQARPQKPDFESLKNSLIRQADDGDVVQAISTLDFMSRHDVTPDLTTFSVLLKACIRTRNFRMGKLVHSKLLDSRIRLDNIVLNSLITLYSKNGDWVTAEKMFESMDKDRDLVSWSAMISCYAHNAMEYEAIETFLEMMEFGEFPNEFCFSAVLQACSAAEEYGGAGEVIFGIALKTGYFGAGVNVGCALIDLYSKGFGDLGLARKVFDQMPEKSSVAWTQMITRISQFGDPRSAIEMFLDMALAGFGHDRFVLSGVLSACTELEWLTFGQQLHGSVIKSGIVSDVCVGCSLVDMYAKCSLDNPMFDSRKVFDRMPAHNVMSWTAVITGYVQNAGRDLEAVRLFRTMMEDGLVKPNHFTFSALLKACANLSDVCMGRTIYGQAVKLGRAQFDFVVNALIGMFAKSDKMEDARKAFDLLFEKNLVSCNTIVDACPKNQNSEEASELLRHIQDLGDVEVDAFTFASLLSGAASIGAVGKGEQIHARLMKAGYESNQSVCNALISMYSRCGNIEAACRVFKGMSEWNVVSWTTMITGFAKHGYAKRALELFDGMLSAGVRPNEVTYVAVLSACSHAGLVEEGWKYFHEMSEKHGMNPRMDHYSCIVDLLGRSGFLEKAVEFIESMPFAADTFVWRTLLSACCVHGNTELGKFAGEMILKQDPNDAAAHVLLSNLHASGGDWEEVTKIRATMKERNLFKEAGCSWIETENKVHKFYVGDSEHPRATEIYEELDELVLRIKELGYVPNTSLVLHEVEEEQKEQYLLQHSEKLAVAFGLISTSEPKPIRIFKNLRVCGDCHAAMKYISLATGREIVVRDSNRFHHMIGGSCSCNDHW